MRIIDILNPAEIKEFENPPIFSYQQRKVFFEIPVGLKSKLNEFVSPVNDVGLVTQMGYFRACGRFFRLNTFRENDLLYVCRILKIKRETIDLTSYASTSLARHREMILREFGIHRFAGLYREFTLEDANHLATKQFSPASIFRSLCDYLRSQGVEATDARYHRTIPWQLSLPKPFKVSRKYYLKKSYLIQHQDKLPP